MRTGDDGMAAGLIRLGASSSQDSPLRDLIVERRAERSRSMRSMSWYRKPACVDERAAPDAAGSGQYYRSDLGVCVLCLPADKRDMMNGANEPWTAIDTRMAIIAIRQRASPDSNCAWPMA